MPHGDLFILIGIGAVFLLLSLFAFIRGKKEEKGYYNTIASRHDVREFLEHDPERPEPGALKIGGWIALVTGLLMIILGGAFLIWR